MFQFDPQARRVYWEINQIEVLSVQQLIKQLQEACRHLGLSTAQCEVSIDTHVSDGWVPAEGDDSTPMAASYITVVEVTPKAEWRQPSNTILK